MIGAEIAQETGRSQIVCVQQLASIVPRSYKKYRKADVSPWTEALASVELLLLHAAPVFYGFGIPHGDNSGVVLIPGLLVTDVSLTELHAWLKRIGYRPYFSGVGLNADCPNLLIQRRLKALAGLSPGRSRIKGPTTSHQ